jgi:predicted DNA binding CopG/RHH family protein
VLDIGEKERWHMKKKTKYTDEPMDLKIIDDFLPSPDRLALKEENIRITITLSKASIEFFKKYARKTHGHYQAMIRRVLDHYVAHYQ